MTGWQNKLRPVFPIFLLGLLLRLLWLIYARPEPVLDFEHYRLLAEGLLDHHQFGYPKATAYRLPLYPLFLSLLMIISRNIFWLSLCNVILSSILIVIVYLFAQQLTKGNRAVSFFGALLCAINPTFVFYSPILASEHLFSLLIISAFLIPFCHSIKLLYRVIMAGFILGLAILTRGEAIFYIPIFLMIVYFISNKKMLFGRRHILFLLSCIIVVFPWYLRNALTFDKSVGLSTMPGVVFYFGHNKAFYGWPGRHETELEGHNEVEAQKLGYKIGIDYIKNNPGKSIKKLFKATFELYKPSGWAVTCNTLVQKGSINIVDSRPLHGKRQFAWMCILFYIGALILAILSPVFSRKISFDSWAVLLGIVFMSWICYAVVFHSNERYRFMAEIVLCILAAITVDNILDRASDKSEKTYLKN